MNQFKNLTEGNYVVAVKDSNGCSVSLNTALKTIAPNCVSGVIIAPNPSNNYFTALIGNDIINETISIWVYDVSGKLVYNLRQP